MIDVATGHFSDDASFDTVIQRYEFDKRLRGIRAFGVISCLLYLCNAIKPDNTVKDDIKDLFCSMPDVPVFMIGFTSGWDNNPLWK